MNIEVRRKGAVTILDITGRLTIGSGDVGLRDTFPPLLDGGARRFIFNMSGVPFMDSAGLGETVACFKRAREHSGTVKIVLREGGKPHDSFVITNLHQAFEIYHDEEEAIASFIGESVV